MILISSNRLVALLLLFVFPLAACSGPADQVESHLKKAKRAEKKGNYDAARAHYEDVLKIAPLHADALYGLGEDEYRKKNKVMAENYFTRAIQSESDHAKAHYRFGCVLEDRNETAEAAKAYAKAIQLDPKLGKAYLKLADLQKDSDPAQAFHNYEQGLKIEKDDPEAYYDFGNLLRAQSRWDLAESAYRNAIKLNPDYAKALYRLGSVLRDQDKSDESLPHLKKAYELEPDNVEYLYAYASALKDTRRFKEAIPLFARVLKAEPDHEKALYKLASSLESSGEIAAAKARYAEAAEKIQEDPELKARAAEKARILR